MSKTPPKAPGFDGVTDQGRGCCFPLWPDAEKFRHGVSLYCGAPRPNVARPYCTFHEDALRPPKPATPSNAGAIAAVSPWLKIRRA